MPSKYMGNIFMISYPAVSLDGDELFPVHYCVIKSRGKMGPKRQDVIPLPAFLVERGIVYHGLEVVVNAQGKVKIPERTTADPAPYI
jgi:hypothetical protein